MIKTWGTWDDRRIEFERLTQQHLSNIYYYMRYTMGYAYNVSDRTYIMRVLEEKYGGILPYHPDRTFEFEKIRLIELGYLQDNGDIVVDGKKIGWYEEPLKKTQEYYDSL